MATTATHATIGVLLHKLVYGAVQVMKPVAMAHVVTVTAAAELAAVHPVAVETAVAQEKSVAVVSVVTPYCVVRTMNVVAMVKFAVMMVPVHGHAKTDHTPGNAMVRAPTAPDVLLIHLIVAQTTMRSTIMAMEFATAPEVAPAIVYNRMRLNVM